MEGPRSSAFLKAIARSVRPGPPRKFEERIIPLPGAHNVRNPLTMSDPDIFTIRLRLHSTCAR